MRNGLSLETAGSFCVCILNSSNKGTMLIALAERDIETDGFKSLPMSFWSVLKIILVE